ncbi:MAG: tRNA pseudouridine(55) synthase TruB [Epsilonproteobacteria bacterium]|nr:tRNA pseudouridine(55) synthase TruB [Campylobacterota bacterium]NPA56762.1 tRNA pseudouridine(55) synthase TruB [Campylobacterota bacterium]
MNRLFVAYKPPFISSNSYLNTLKKRYRVRRAGFSGILDPFASGTLVVAFGHYTKLFRFLKKYPKRYRATLWLGAESGSLDIERVERVRELPPFPEERVRKVVQGFQGEFTYLPPLYSAKKVGGERAYRIAQRGGELSLSPVTSHIFQIRLLSYRHPFLSFEADVSEGTYIRSLGEAIARELGVPGSLSSLERVREGDFIYQGEIPLDPLDYLVSSPNRTSLAPEQIKAGRKIGIEDLEVREEGLYHLVFDTFFTIIEVKGGEVRYLLNLIPRSFR